MEKYELLYTGEHLENIAEMFLKLSSTYKRMARSVCDKDNPLAAGIALQIEEAGKLIKGYSGFGSKEVPFAKELEAIDRALAKNGVKLKDSRVILREDKRHELTLRLKTVRKKCPTAREIALVISEALGVSYQSFENNRVMVNGVFNTFIFVEAGRFELVHGIARLGKSGKSISGDVTTINALMGGRCLIGLCDGMGSGVEANYYGSMVIDLIEDALGCGFSLECALAMVNTTLATIEGMDNPITVDISIIDTFLGRAQFVKLGAVSTYIIRDGWVEAIWSDTLPMGVFYKADFDCIEKKLYPGDYVVMVSDGVLEAIPVLDKESQFMAMLTQLQSKNSSGMANELMDMVVSNSNQYMPIDDMTIIVTGIYGKDV